MTFQQSVNLYPSPGQEGTQASMNPLAVALPPEGSYKAGTNGVYQSRFAWLDGTDSTLLNNTGTGAPVGFLMNTGKGTIPVGETGSMFIQAGVDLAAYTKGDFWVKATTPWDKRSSPCWRMAPSRPAQLAQPSLARSKLRG
jgi:hypothetical protein